MEYSLALILHLLCAIIFLGFVFTDVIVLPILKKRLGEEEHQKIMQIIISRGIKIFPPAVLLLVLSGGYMFSKYINSQAGFANSPLQILLLIKVFLVLLIVAGVVYSLICKFTKKEPHKFMKKHTHKVVLILGFFISILAKMMFFV